jgi:hypothetical protein
MNKHFFLIMLVGALLITTSCSEDRAVAPDPVVTTGTTSGTNVDPAIIAAEIVHRSGWEVDAEAEIPVKAAGGSDQVQSNCQIIDFERELIGDVVHYSYQIQVGSGPYDIIGLHRVVKERRPYRPIRTHKNVFMLHGDLKDFEGCFMPGYLSTTYPDDFGIAVHLAREGVDVWGMDQTYCSVPEEVVDFSFMADWDFYKHVDDTDTGLAIARMVRRLTGSGFRKFNLLGYSGGAALGYALLNEETKRPPGKRHVGGFIPVDQGMFSDNPDYAATVCAQGQYYADLMDAGEYAEFNALPLFGVPARDDPEGPSALIPGFTNLQAALALAVYPYYEGFPYHFLAGSFDSDGIPAGLQYANVDLWVDFLCNAPPWFPNGFSRDEYISQCGPGYAPWTDSFANIQVPVLAVSAIGGFGIPEYYTLQLLGSSDITLLEIGLHPPDEIALDFAHIDIFIADNAPELVWDPILQWIENHLAREVPENVELLTAGQ